MLSGRIWMNDAGAVVIAGQLGVYIIPKNGVEVASSTGESTRFPATRK